MKTILQLLLIMVLMSNCRSINKLVEKGQYDEAIQVAARKLAGKKNKKTDHIIALEDAFAKITERDMNSIQLLYEKTNPNKWDQIIDISNKIEKRQNKISAFLPLVSKDGYEAEFKFVKTHTLIEDAKANAAAYYYEQGTKLLEDYFITKDKEIARDAYYTFDNIKKYQYNYKDVVSLMSKAKSLGTSHILVSMSMENMAGPVEKIMWDNWSNESYINFDSSWKKFYFHDDTVTNYDDHVQLNWSHLDVSPEKETITHHIDRKQIVDGWVYVKKRNGEIKTDSLGNKIKKDVYVNIHARVTEIIRNKNASLSLEMVIKDFNTGKLKQRNKLFGNSDFNDIAITFSGDRRAICDHDIGRIKDFPLPFPTDVDLLLAAGFSMEHDLKQTLRNI